MQTELFIIRHGETTWNAQERFQGHQNSDLTPRGHAQAEAAAAYLGNHKFTALYSSDLSRTLQTAAPISLSTALTIIQEPALRERNMGIFEGLTREEIKTRYAAEYLRYAAREPDHMIPHGGSLSQLHQRALTIMQTLARRHVGENIVVISHGGFIATFLRYLHGIPLQDVGNFAIHNGSVSRTRFDLATEQWEIVSLGEVLA